MIRKFASAVLSILLVLASFARCTVDLGLGVIKELNDNKEGILQEIGEIWDGFLEEISEWAG